MEQHRADDWEKSAVGQRQRTQQLEKTRRVLNAQVHELREAEPAREKKIDGLNDKIAKLDAALEGAAKSQGDCGRVGRARVARLDAHEGAQERARARLKARDASLKHLTTAAETLASQLTDKNVTTEQWKDLFMSSIHEYLAPLLRPGGGVGGGGVGGGGEGASESAKQQDDTYGRLEEIALDQQQKNRAYMEVQNRRLRAQLSTREGFDARTTNKLRADNYGLMQDMNALRVQKEALAGEVAQLRGDLSFAAEASRAWGGGKREGKTMLAATTPKATGQPSPMSAARRSTSAATFSTKAAQNGGARAQTAGVPSMSRAGKRTEKIHASAPTRSRRPSRRRSSTRTATSSGPHKPRSTSYCTTTRARCAASPCSSRRSRRRSRSAEAAGTTARERS